MELFHAQFVTSYHACSRCRLLLNRRGACQPTYGQKLLRWELKPGQALDVQFTQDMTIQMNAMGRDLQSSADMGMTMRWNVESVEPDGTARIRQSIDQLSMRLETPGSDPIEYDSAQEEEPVGTAVILATSVDPMVGVEFTQQMSSAGEILAVELSEQAKQQLDAAPSGAQLKEILSQNGLKALLSQAATVFPTTPVKPGDSWTGSTTSKSPVGNLSMDMTYTYRGTEMSNGQPLEKIDVEMTVRFPEPNATNGMSIAVRNQKNTGTLYFDAAAGRFAMSELNQNMRLVTTVGGQEQSQIMSTILRMEVHPRVTRCSSNWQRSQQLTDRPSQLHSVRVEQLSHGFEAGHRLNPTSGFRPWSCVTGAQNSRGQRFYISPLRHPHLNLVTNDSNFVRVRFQRWIVTPCAVADLETPRVPWTDDGAVFNVSVGQRRTHMWAEIV